MTACPCRAKVSIMIALRTLERVSDFARACEAAGERLFRAAEGVLRRECHIVGPESSSPA